MRCLRCGEPLTHNGTLCNECAEEEKWEARQEQETGADRCPPRE
jgi:hypothetical protein